MTVLVESQIDSPLFRTADGRLEEFYTGFLSKVEDKLNTLSVVQLLLKVAATAPNQTSAIEFLSKFKPKAAKNDQANLLLLSSLAALTLESAEPADTKHVKAKELLQAAQAILDRLETVTPVHRAYYSASARLYKQQGNFDLYYAEALRYLGCTDLATVPLAEQQTWAFDISIAALLGDNVFNFGELLSNGVLQSLEGTPNEWLVRLLTVFNSGDVDGFAALEPAWTSNSDLAPKATALRNKLVLMALMEQVYHAPAHKRIFPFSDIAAHARVAEDQVEWIVMRALSRGLVKGTLDGVTRTAHLHWVQPRVLDLKQLARMHENLQTWIGTVKSAAEQIRTQGAELLVE